jgi:hypothetical protein
MENVKILQMRLTYYAAKTIKGTSFVGFTTKTNKARNQTKQL